MAALVATLVAALLAVTSGVRFTVGGLRISARSPVASSIVAIGLVAAWAVLAARAGQAARDLTSAWSAVERHAWSALLCLAAAAAGFAVGYGTFSAAGADASGYLSQAALWASRHTRLADPLASIAGWPAGDPGISAPLGWRAAAERGWQVPTYGPGLPLLMAIPFQLGGSLAACLVVAASAAFAVIATGVLAFQLAGQAAAIVAAITIATTPVFLFQSIQPMSDVPVTAAWMMCWAVLIRSAGGRRQTADRRQMADGRRQTAEVSSGRAILAGLACAVAILIRPNLAPLALVPFLYVFWMTRLPAPSSPRTLAPLFFALPAAVAALFLGWIQWQWYGSPLRSGYGTTDQLFALANVWPNTSRYIAWLVSTAPVIVLAVAGLWIRRGIVAWTFAAFGVLNAGAYLVYLVFDEWSYLRFLLPALALGAVLVGVAIGALLDRLPAQARVPALAAAVLIVGFTGLSRAQSLDTFQFAAAQRRVWQIDRYLDAVLPDRAVIVAGEQSGAVRLDTGHSILRWEAVPPGDMGPALSALESSGHPVWVLLDSWEEPLVRAKFAGVPALGLDWPPAVDAGETRRTRAWQLTDRARYLDGQRVPTDRLR